MESSNKNNRKWLRYAGLASEMMAMLGITAFLGFKLDKWWDLELPIFLIIFPLLALGVTLWRIIKTFEKKDG
ncbi:MAG TPA: AtpZ/AtpI family protein [Chitinophagaceae bacterium]|nr:AtpZ/AtpI family protein [Chitinophagaceae bacterium]